MKMFSIFSVIILGLLWPISGASQVAQDGDIDVEAHARGPIGMKIEAKARGGSISDDGTTTTIVVPVSGLKTGIALRDEHMKEALEASKFPEAKMTVNDSDLVVPGVDDSIGRDVPGALELHGVTNKVIVHYDAVKDCEGHVGVMASFVVKMEDFGIRPPSYAGVSVKNEVKVVARFRVKDS